MYAHVTLHGIIDNMLNLYTFPDNIANKYDRFIHKHAV